MPPPIAAGQTAQLPVRVIPSLKALSAQSGPVLLAVSVRYTSGDLTMSAERSTLACDNRLHKSVYESRE